jgi:hypothetical protein
MVDKISLPKIAKGKRPVVFDDPSIDHLVTMVLEMSAELYAVYQRLDTVERLLDEAKVVDRSKIDAYKPDAAAEAERAEWRELFLERLFRTVRADRG